VDGLVLELERECECNCLFVFGLLGGVERVRVCVGAGEFFEAGPVLLRARLDWVVVPYEAVTAGAIDDEEWPKEPYPCAGGRWEWPNLLKLRGFGFGTTIIGKD
jgi:hypothetical protein